MVISNKFDNVYNRFTNDTANVMNITNDMAKVVNIFVMDVVNDEKNYKSYMLIN